MRTLKQLIAILTTTLLMVFTPSTIAQEMQDYIDKTCARDCVDAQELLGAVHSAADSYDIDPVAILAIVSVESSFRPRATNGSSVGLTQVLRRLHRDKFKGPDPYDVQDNIFAGVQVLSNCLKKHKGLYTKAFQCYNGYGKKSIKYAAKVQSAINKIRTLSITVPGADLLGKFIQRIDRD